MKQLSNTKGFSIFVILTYLVVACGVRPGSVTQGGYPVSTAPSIPTQTKNGLSTQFHGEITQTPISTRIFPTNIPLFPTVSPTYSTSEAEAVILDLINENGGCVYPCLWGFFPGETYSQQIRDFLERFGSISRGMIYEEDQGYVLLHIPVEDVLIRPTLEYGENPADKLVEWLSLRLEILEKVEGGFAPIDNSLLYTDKFPNLTLSNMLKTYGKPSEVMLLVTKGQNTFELLIYWQDLGIASQYSMPLKRIGDTFSQCPLNNEVQLWVWPSERGYSMDEFAAMLYGQRIGREWLANYIPLELATSITVADFFTLFRENSMGTCLETPTILWPDP